MKKILGFIIVFLFAAVAFISAGYYIFYLPIKEIFKTNPVTFVNISITIITYGILFGGLFLVIKLLFWGIKQIDA